LPAPTATVAQPLPWLTRGGNRYHGATVRHLTPPRRARLPQQKKLRTLEAETSGAGAFGALSRGDTVASIATRFAIPKKQAPLPHSLGRRKKPAAQHAPPPPAAPEESEGLQKVESAFVSDAAEAAAQFEQQLKDADDDEIPPGIETDDDVVQFYAKYGQDSGVSSNRKFFYCVPVDNELEYLPYDLRVVKLNMSLMKTGDMYFTISAKGVMRIEIGEDESTGASTKMAEFMSLADWVREKAYFKMWRRNPFFRNNVKIQAFRTWVLTVRRRKFLRKRAQLQKRLFIAQPTFCAPICEILKIIDEIRSLDLASLHPPLSKMDSSHPPLNTDPSKNSGQAALTAATVLREYKEAQGKKKEEQLGERISALITKIQQILEAVCKEAQKQAKLYQESIRDHKELEDTTGVDLYQRTGEKTKSMVAIKEEKVQRAETYRRVMEEASRLADLIRLADYMISEALIEQALGTAEWLVNVLQNTRATGEEGYYVPGFDYDGSSLTWPAGGTVVWRRPLGKKVFLSHISFSQEKEVMDFSPDEHEFETTLLSITEGVSSMLSNAPTLLKIRVFGQFFDSRLEGIRVAGVIQQSPRYQRARDNLAQIVADDFEAARKFAFEAFEKYRETKEFYDKWDPANLDQEKRSKLEEYFDMMGKHSEHMKVMKGTSQVGILVMDSKTNIISVLQPKIRTAKEDLKVKMLAKFFQEVEESKRKFYSLVLLLEKRPEEKNLKEFYLYKGANEEGREKQAKIEGEFEEVRELHDYLMNLNVDVPSAQYQDYLQLVDLAERFTKALDTGEEFCRSHISEFTAHVEFQVRELKDKVQRLSGDVLKATLLVPEDNAPETDQMLEQLASMQQRVDSLNKEAKTLLRYKHAFAGQEDQAEDLQDRQLVLSELGLSELIQVEDDVIRRTEIWTEYFNFHDMRALWMEGPVRELNRDEIEPQVQAVKLATKNLKKKTKGDQMTVQLLEEIEAFEEDWMSTVQTLANPAMEDRHWAQIFAMLGQPDFDGDQPEFRDFSVQSLIGRGVSDPALLEQVQVVSAAASKERSLSKALQKMLQEWEGVEFKILEHKDTETYKLSGAGIDEIQMILDDQVVKIASMLASPFIKPLLSEAEEWADRLNTLQNIIDSQLACQQTWMYLEPIFSSPDIMKQMPNEAQKFSKVDSTYRDIMEKTRIQPDCRRISQKKDRLHDLQDCNRLLDEIEKGLAEYLERKRVAFPRFFFLSDDAMLEILSQTKDPTRVQPHLGKCFEGIATLQFKGSANDILAMRSVEGEEVPFAAMVRPKEAQGAVEKWLLQTEKAMFDSVHAACMKGVAEYPAKPRTEWVLEHPGQVVLVVTAVFWTADVEQALTGDKGALRTYADKCTAQLNDIVELVRGDLSKLNRATLSALVVMDVHARDVVADMSTRDLEGLADAPFAWTSQLRMYHEKGAEGALFEGEDTVNVRMMNASIEYGYEYLGNSSRLVITPLTDRCYRTLMGAIHLNLGGAPEGPAGTGKTETTKDLAKALARQCVVFNCSDDLGYLTMAKFFKGLATSGAWACFDEFNRINLEVLSVVAQQVLDIQNAVKAKKERFWFEGAEIPLKRTCNAFITMNPGYAGRSELPDNLKALFRTVAMMVPDYAMIGEIILYSYGYKLARDSARKIVATYKLCSEQLSSQDHYDYGMRAVMSVLRAAGNLKRKFPDLDELKLMLRSIVDVNLCKFLAHDVPLFHGIVSDLFPGVNLPTPDYTSLENTIKAKCEARNLQAVEYFMTKTIQLYEMIIVRHGLMIVGEPFSGKSCCLTVLAESLSDLKERGVEGTLFEHVKMEVMNPKAVWKGDLYGESDRATQEWKDGVLGVTFRRLADPTDTSSDRRWVVLDGPVDAVWIENMNTVLDDNKKLCLPNSEIIAMHPNQSMIFEVGDLKAASPATVSRCGMVYLEPHKLGWEPLLASWVNTLPADALGAELVQRIRSLFLWLLPALLRWVKKECREVSPTSETNLAQAAMRLMTGLLEEFRPVPLSGEEGGETPGPGAAMDGQAKKQWVDGLALFSLVWSTGCTGDLDSREKFDVFFRKVVAGDVPSDFAEFVGVDHVVSDLSVPMMPSGDSKGPRTVFEYVFDKEKAGQGDPWRLWTDTVGEGVAIPEGAGFADIIIPTGDMATVTFLLDMALRDNYPMLLVGPSGTGKSVYIRRHLISGLPKEDWVQVFLTFSARTTAGMAQDQIDGRLDKRRKGFYGPPVGQRCVVFVDDMNMPAKEEYGAQPPIELLRQFMDFSGWYTRDGKSWMFKNIQDTVFVGAMGPPGGGRTFVTDRFLRHFSCVALTEADSGTLTHIFHTILDWHLEKLMFPQGVKDLGAGIVACTKHLYGKAVKSLLPTPAKSHYQFNLRDLARVIQGVMLLGPSSLPEDEGQGVRVYQRLFVHEALRVFCDRLVDDKDRQWLLDTLEEGLKEHLGTSMEELFPHLLDHGLVEKWPGVAAEAHKDEDGAALDETDVPADQKRLELEHLRRIFYTDFMEFDSEPMDRQYREVQDVPAIITVVDNYLGDHNTDPVVGKRPMPLAVFLFACEHVSRICRVLKQPGGNMLLAGVGGSGRQSLTRLAAFICGMQCFQVEISKHYSKNDWHEDLKTCLRQAGAEGKPTVFLFSDTQIKDESFVEDLNNILNSGEVPNMFASDEKVNILELVREPAKKKNLETPLELWGFFTDRCKQNLHTVLCMSPIGEAFRERLRQNPSLINCCTIDWFQVWPADALEAVAHKNLNAMAGLTDEQRAGITTVCKGFHSSLRGLSKRFLDELGRYNYVTPTSYLELLSLFKTLLAKKRKDNEVLQARYLNGLAKLKAASEDVAKLQEELTAKQPVLKETVTQVERMLVEIAREKKEVVEPQAAEVKKEEEAAKAVAAQAKELKDSCDAELAVAMPILEDALSALDTIKDADIQYIKKLPNPPAAIKLVMHAVCIVLQEKPVRGKDDSGKTVDDWWKTSVNLLGRKTFIEEVRNYDKDNIDVKVITKIREQFTSDTENFTPAVARKASTAAEGLCKWVHAMDKYEVVAKKVAPLRESAAAAAAEYEEVMVGLRAKQGELQVLLDKLAAMEKQLSEAQERKQQLEDEVELTSVKLERAEKLIGGLGGEQARWSRTAEDLKVAYHNLTGDMLISAGIIGYLGAFTADYRSEICADWQKLLREQNLPCSEKISMQAVLGNPVQIREWLIQGLPNDSFSIDNAIVIENARRWPLLIDPQGQANKWVKNMYRRDNLQVIKLSDGAAFLRTLENAIQFGLPVLLENIEEELDPSLEPLLLKQVFVEDGMQKIRLGENNIEYSSDFAFFMTTKMRNPHYLPEISVKVTLLNFMITPTGLSDQMLNVVVSKERPDLEEKRDMLIRESADNKKKLSEIEDQILKVLSESEGNILDDESAIATISEAKVLGKAIEESQQIAEQTEREIEQSRGHYQPCGEFTSLLFFCITDLGTADPMYQYSLPWFVNLFVASIKAAAPAEEVSIRLTNIQDHFTYSLYCNICRSLFERDKLLFSFLLCTRIEGAKGRVDPDDWTFLLSGGIGDPGDQPNPARAWMTDSSWKECLKLSRLAGFEGLDTSVITEPDSWKAVYDSEEPHKIELPGAFAGVSPFHRVLITRVFRLDKVTAAVQDYVASVLGQRFILPPPFDLGACYSDSSNTTPLIFVLSQGSDPTALLQQFAAERGMDSHLKNISLGDGQGPKAEKLILEGREAGDWVVLFNCHLSPSWMSTLDKLCEGLEKDKDKVSTDFRLWLTSYPSPKFPVNVLQNGVKMVMEPPKGIKANMRRTYHLEPLCNEEFLEGCSKPKEFKALLFSLSFMHALVQERRRFGPLGWNVSYSFDDSDLKISVQQLRMFIDANPSGIPYEALRYVTGECNYGGRVTDDKDRILLNTMMEAAYSTEAANVVEHPLSVSGTYKIPQEGPWDSYLEYINKLPITPAPEAFGLHMNADITKDQNDTLRMFGALLEMGGGGGGGGSDASKQDEVVATVIKECLEQLPERFDLEKCKKKFPLSYEESLNSVLSQEMERFNKLTDVVRASLNNISLAIQGLQVMSSDMDKAYKSLAINQVPALWHAASYPSLKPLGGYLKDLYARLNMLHTWYAEGQPSVFWISGFYFVHSFLAASLQNYARKHKVPIDEVVYDFRMMGMDPADYPVKPQDGCYVHGLFLEGCTWDPDNNMLCESKPKVLFTGAPCMHLMPVRHGQDAPPAGEDQNIYRCPIYRTADRKGTLATTGHSTNFVMFCSVPSDKPASHWTMRGVCLLCSLSSE